MKLNFMNVFNKEKVSIVEKVFRTTTVTLLILYGAIIITMHGMQGYKWYAIRTQKKRYEAQSVAFDVAVKTRSDLQRAKQQLQEKIDLYDNRKKEQVVISNQLKALYNDPTITIKTVSINDHHFNSSFQAETVQKAHQFLKSLKEQRLIHKARIMHLSKTDGYYTVQIQGSFKRV